MPRSISQCLCICPARELARQLFEVITEMGKFTNIKTFLAVKDGTSTSYLPIPSARATYCSTPDVETKITH